MVWLKEKVRAILNGKIKRSANIKADRSILTKIKDTLCDLSSSDLKKYEKEIIKEVTSPKYICKKCVRVSNSKDS